MKSSGRRILSRVGFAVAAVVAIAVPTAAAAGGSDQGGKPVGSGDNPLARSGAAVPTATVDQGRRPLDVRADAADDPADAIAPVATAKLRSTLGSQGVLTVDPVTGTPRFVGKLNGFLTAPSSASPQDVALGYARRNAAALGLTDSDFEGLRLTRDYTDTAGITHLIWAQSVDGVEAFGNGLYANVAKDGRLINLMGSPVSGLGAIRSLDPELSARARSRPRSTTRGRAARCPRSAAARAPTGRPSSPAATPPGSSSSPPRPATPGSRGG